MKATQIILILALAHFSLQDYRTMSHEDIRAESIACGASRTDKSACSQRPNCFYVEWYVTKVDEVLPFCFSFNEVMKYYFKDPDTFFSEKQMKQKTIERENLCTVIENLDSFLDIEGHIALCEVSSTAIDA